MTPPFQLGDTVEIIGPSRFGNSDHIGEKFTITERWQHLEQDEYSTTSLPWYPASSLRLVPKFKKGDRVYCECGTDPMFPMQLIQDKTGTVMDPDYITCYGARCVHVKWDDDRPRNLVLAEGLQLVEELQVGDWVEVIGPFIAGYLDTGKRIFQLTEIHTEHDGNKSYRSPGQPRYLASSLRKLRPDEITHPVVSAEGKIHERLNWLQDQIDKLTEESDKRLSAIESRLNALGPAHADLSCDVESLAGMMGDLKEQIGIMQRKQNEFRDKIREALL